MPKRTSLKLTDERQRKLDRASSLIAKNEHDEPPMSVVIDAALTHLLESYENIDAARKEYNPETIQDIANTSVLKLHFRTSIDQNYR